MKGGGGGGIFSAGYFQKLTRYCFYSLTKPSFKQAVVIVSWMFLFYDIKCNFSSNLPVNKLELKT